jgi:hypothetical protein
MGENSTNIRRSQGLDAWAERAKERVACSDVESIQVLQKLSWE